jgi:hypothetical protein
MRVLVLSVIAAVLLAVAGCVALDKVLVVPETDEAGYQLYELSVEDSELPPVVNAPALAEMPAEDRAKYVAKTRPAEIPPIVEDGVNLLPLGLGAPVLAVLGWFAHAYWQRRRPTAKPV